MVCLLLCVLYRRAQSGGSGLRPHGLVNPFRPLPYATSDRDHVDDGSGRHPLRHSQSLLTDSSSLTLPEVIQLIDQKLRGPENGGEGEPHVGVLQKQLNA